MREAAVGLRLERLQRRDERGLVLGEPFGDLALECGCIVGAHPLVASTQLDEKNQQVDCITGQESPVL